MKIGIVFFHKNIKDIYPEEWVDKCILSIKEQTFSDFVVYEIDYGNSNLNLIKDSKFYSISKLNYADAMNFIITEAFDDACDFVFNTNLDDFYHENRIKRQIKYLKDGYDIVSTDFCYVDEDNNFIQNMNILNHGCIKENLNRDHNMIAHPSVGMSRKFWSDSRNRYDIYKTPAEDLDLWKSAINNDYVFYIVDEVLLYYRIHKNQVSNKN